jgi:hypothetical protein
MLHAWFIGGFQYESGQQRVLWYKQLYATETMFDAGIRFVGAHFDGVYNHVTTKHEPYQCDMRMLWARWYPTLAAQKVIMTVQAVADMKMKNAVVVGVCLYDALRPICCIRCILTKVITPKNHEERRFVVSHWTLGTGV